MSKVSQAKKQHRSMRGKQVDMDLLRKRNELTPAVGNARVNARGDELGPGGQIIKKREEVVAEYYASVGTAVEATGRSTVPVTDQPVAAVEPAKKTVTRTTKKADNPAEVAAEEAALDAQEEWIEDADGNFIQKGD